jgi:mRNA-degrading endonuclease YafQ of YafQ-DinJ toxin-antitoxin module
MKILQTKIFEKTAKKLHQNAKRDLDTAIRMVVDNPLCGEMKKGDLAGIRVYKFKMVNQLTLLAYRYDDDAVVLTLLVLGSHENFYRDLKKGC